jgi:arylsulfatase A-like enzyme
VRYVLIDDLRTQMAPFGHADMTTPHFSACADTAVLVEQAHCNSQMCVPTRNSFMTGRRPDVTRVFNDGIGVANFRVTGPDWTTLPGAFKEAG